MTEFVHERGRNPEQYYQQECEARVPNAMPAGAGEDDIGDEEKADG
jgi:hypothetical protein